MSLVRSGLRWLRATALEHLGVHERQRSRLDGTRAAVLMYHRVLPKAEAERLCVEPGMFVTPETFRQHLAWIRDSYRPIALDELVTRLLDGRRLPEKAVVITFDDGWRDNHDHALPALVESGLPATVFLATDRVGTLGAFWPDRVSRELHRQPPGRRRRTAARLGFTGGRDPVTGAIEALKPMAETERAELLAHELGDDAGANERELVTWEEVDRMARAGIAFESHGASHSILTGLTAVDVAAELQRCRTALAERGHGKNAIFAYPSGMNDATVRLQVRGAGFRAALTTEPRPLCVEDDSMALPRIGVHQDVSARRAGFHRAVPGPRA